MYKFSHLLIAVLLSTTVNAATRSKSALSEFRRETPCPVEHHKNKCPGYQIDHITPLCAGGEDHKKNMQWITIEDHKRKTRNDVLVCRAMKLY